MHLQNKSKLSSRTMVLWYWNAHKFISTQSQMLSLSFMIDPVRCIYDSPCDGIHIKLWFKTAWPLACWAGSYPTMRSTCVPKHHLKIRFFAFHLGVCHQQTIENSTRVYPKVKVCSPTKSNRSVSTSLWYKAGYPSQSQKSSNLKSTSRCTAHLLTWFNKRR